MAQDEEIAEELDAERFTAEERQREAEAGATVAEGATNSPSGVCGAGVSGTEPPDREGTYAPATSARYASARAAS